MRAPRQPILARMAPDRAKPSRAPREPEPTGAAPAVHSGHKRILRNVLGFLVLLLGIAGLVLPFLQGVLMIVAGLAMIDLPIKHRAHVLLLRWRWYQAVARRHAAVHARWHAWREARKDARAADAKVSSRRPRD